MDCVAVKRQKIDKINSLKDIKKCSLSKACAEVGMDYLTYNK
jgi:hypothetical protein